MMVIFAQLLTVSAVGPIDQMHQCLVHIPKNQGKYPFTLKSYPDETEAFCGCVREGLKNVVAPGDMQYFYPGIKNFLPYPNPTSSVTNSYAVLSSKAQPLRDARVDKIFVQNCVNEAKKINPKGMALMVPSIDEFELNLIVNRMYGFSYNLIAESSLGGEIHNSGHWYQAVTANKYMSRSDVMNMAIGAAFCHPPEDLIGTSESLGFR